MKKPDTTLIDQEWPAEELEEVDSCPYCGSTARTIAYENVQDWSFYCAPGKWTYWDCARCEALYLNPRPTEASIGKAYARYYTHSNNARSIVQQTKIRVKNEIYCHSVNVNLSPRLHISKWFGFAIKPFRMLVHIPFELETLANLPKGKLLDVGCGSGNMLNLAKQLGWDVTGLEIDTNAVKAARGQALNVIEGDFRKLQQFTSKFECIICSHVLEHVHLPLELLALLLKALKPQGVLLLSLPNSKSYVRKQFGRNWRGLEAPRHVAIPTLENLIEYLNYLGCTEINQTNVYGITIPESTRIKKRKFYVNLNIRYLIYSKTKLIFTKKSGVDQSDFIQLTVRKNT